MKQSYIFKLFVVSFLTVALCSCLQDNDYTIMLPSIQESTHGIPSDNLATENPEVSENTTSIPNIQYTCTMEGDDAIVTIDMTGIQDAESHDWLRLIGTAEKGQNIWLSIDGEPKGIDVYNTADSESDSKKSVIDLVFLVDNSGSMSDEADAIARDIADWAKKLAASNLDIKFGCVGYNVSGHISGAINLCDANTLNNYLNRSGYSGTGRTVEFSGSDATYLQSTAQKYYQDTKDECGGCALRYADYAFNFRSGANRIYVNFTDEPNYPNYLEKYSVWFFQNQQNWNTTQGTVHTVFSGSTSFTETKNYCEQPWRISEFTGGTKLFASSSFSGVSLDDLPVTGAMQNSYVIRFTNIKKFIDGKPHLLKITVLSVDGRTQAEREFYITFVVEE